MMDEKVSIGPSPANDPDATPDDSAQHGATAVEARTDAAVEPPAQPAVPRPRKAAKRAGAADSSAAARPARSAGGTETAASARRASAERPGTERPGADRAAATRIPLERNLGPVQAARPPVEVAADEERVLPRLARSLVAPLRLIAHLGLGGFMGLLTLLWTVGAVWYLDSSIGLPNVLGLPPQELGLFCAGAAAPPALAWLVLTYFRQASGLSSQMRALHALARQAQVQSETVSLTEQHLKLDTYLSLSDFYLSQMAKEAAILAIHTFRLSKAQEDELWSRFSLGDREVFFRLFFEKPDPNLADRIAKAIVGIDNASKSAHLFSGYYQVFLRHAESVDRGNLMLEAYRHGYLGDLSRLVNKALYGSENPFN